MKNRLQSDERWIEEKIKRFKEKGYKFSDDFSELIIPDGVTTIGKYQFYGFDFLRKVHIPNSVIKIDDFAFAFCHLLESINIPKSVQEIGFNAFDSCMYLKELNISEGVKKISDSFTHCTSLTNVYIPDSVRSLSDSCFWRCDSLETISMPSHLSIYEKTVPEDCKIIKRDSSDSMNESKERMFNRVYKMCN